MRAPETWGLFSLVRSQAIVCLVCVATAIASPAQTLTTLASFNFADGAEPDVALAQSRDGRPLRDDRRGRSQQRWDRLQIRSHSRHADNGLQFLLPGWLY